MRVLLVTTTNDSLTQRVHAELRDRGHDTELLLLADDDDEQTLREVVRARPPELVVAPTLHTPIPEDVWCAHTCLLVHPGPPGDRGPSSLDWAIDTGATRWAVTVLAAGAEADAGDVWATAPFQLPEVGKSDLYRNEVADAASAAVRLAVERFQGGEFKPRPQHGPHLDVVVRPPFDPGRRRVDWAVDPTRTVLRKLRGADDWPGVPDDLFDQSWLLFGGHPEQRLRGAPGRILATRAGAVCRATVDGAVWIPRMCRDGALPDGSQPFPLPSVLALGDLLPPVPDAPAPLEQRDRQPTWNDIGYAQHGRVGHLRFAFPGGASSTDHCRRLLAAYRFACTRPTDVLLLGGDRGVFGTGIHLGVIENAADPAQEAWDNTSALNDLVEAVLRTTDRLVVAAVGSNAAAGGAMLALAADEVWCRRGAVFDTCPGLAGHGSGLWTYTLPRRVGADHARRLVGQAVPLTADAAARAGLVDRVFAASPDGFAADAVHAAVDVAADPRLPRRLAAKRAARDHDEAERPLADHRAEELRGMREVFFDPEADYHALRAAFVRGQPARTPTSSTR